MDAAIADAEFDSIDDLIVSLGGISPKRLRYSPAPGTATVRDLARLLDSSDRLYELVNGTLVEKIVGAAESFVTGKVLTRIKNWNRESGNLGMALGADGPMKLMKKLVRLPDVSFTNWDRVPGRRVPSEPVPNLAPDLAVEVLSEGNTREEMQRKLKEYFLSEVQLVWYIDPRTRRVQVYTSPDDVTELGEKDTLYGGDVLPGFSVPVAQLFDQLTPAPKAAITPKASGGKKPKKRK